MTEVEEYIKTEEGKKLFSSFLLSKELRNAITEAKKKLAQDYPEPFLSYVRSRLKRKGVSPEAIEEALERAKNMTKR